ncbi:alpha beta-hydrolase [Coniophora puteana RWD-64-598 SS2]|uniref:Alpha beta-hydrolase n=1 Tax=Coniophora puteana (strain RWD-64-598) TaxID=741705 RepID=A0A5M3MH87_CONPW|nr:alpha beta-hydrolase [Coniophora puteana RWD-64-598 SS2]EIW78144.1 alpha beta-hydrolase [Coniophora puteana RWD-64-598 SS2]
MRVSINFVLALVGALTASAAPIQEIEDWVSSVTQVAQSDIDGWTPYTQFARAAYCDPSATKTWTCGEACDAVPGFQATLTGGDGDTIQNYFVGYWPDQNAVVVAHEGTDPTQFQSDLTDADIPMENLDAGLFPGVPDAVQVHKGFADEHAKTAKDILTEVNNLISQHSATEVVLVGHSLGGALSELESLYMTLNLPSSINVKGQTYGTPRVGNGDYASFFDGKVGDFIRINNKKDLIPIVPGRFLGFSHVQGETHITDDGTVYECPGDDDADDDQCTIKTVPNVFDGDITNHLGPYPGNIYMGTIYCT